MTGKVAAFFIQPGDHIEKGQTLAQLEATALRQQLQRARVQLRNALNKPIKIRRLAKAKYQAIHRQYTHTHLTAPQPGIVTGILVQPGQPVLAGQAIVRLAQAGQKAIQINVPRERLLKIAVAQKAKIIAKGISPSISDGTISEIIPDNNRAFFIVRIALSQRNSSFPLGMQVDVIIEETQKQQAASIPKTALFTAVLANKPTACVWVVDTPTQSVYAQPVTILQLPHQMKNNLFVSGLADKARIVIADPNNLRDKQKVTFSVPAP